MLMITEVRCVGSIEQTLKDIKDRMLDPNSNYALYDNGRLVGKAVDAWAEPRKRKYVIVEFDIIPEYVNFYLNKGFKKVESKI